MLLFDRFSSRRDAAAFAAEVTRKFGREAGVYDDDFLSELPPRFPVELNPPVVWVLRDYDDDDMHPPESRIARLVNRFHGKFNGTATDDEKMYAHVVKRFARLWGAKGPDDHIVRLFTTQMVSELHDRKLIVKRAVVAAGVRKALEDSYG